MELSKVFNKSQFQNKCSTTLSKLSLVLIVLAILIRYGLRIFLGESCILYRMINDYIFIAISSLALALGAISFLNTMLKEKFKNKKLIITSVVLPILLMFGELLFLPRARSISYRMMCGTNLSKIGKALLVYIETKNDGRFPDNMDSWNDILLNHSDISEDDLICGHSFLPLFSYGFNKNLEGLNIEQIAEDTVLLFELEEGRKICGGSELLATKHRNGSNIFYVGMWVRFERVEDFNDLKWKP